MNIPGLTDDQLQLIKSFFPSNTQFKIFGSRAKGNHREMSDLDICITSNISRADITRIEEKLQESDLLFTVDVVMYDDCDEQFQKLINDTAVLIKT